MLSWKNHNNMGYYVHKFQEYWMKRSDSQLPVSHLFNGMFSAALRSLGYFLQSTNVLWEEKSITHAWDMGSIRLTVERLPDEGVDDGCTGDSGGIGNGEGCAVDDWGDDCERSGCGYTLLRRFLSTDLWRPWATQQYDWKSQLDWVSPSLRGDNSP